MNRALRHRILDQVDPEMRDAPGLSPFNKVVVLGILLLVAIGVLETEVHGLQRLGGVMALLKVVLFAFFTIEYVLRLWVAALNPRYRSTLAYALTPSALLDLAVIVTLFLPFLGFEGAVFRLVQMIRLLRLARIGRYSRALNLVIEAIRSRKTELAMSAALGFSVMLGASTLLYLVEGGIQPDAFGSIPRAMWWAVATLTTVGYGDVVPVTALGRILAAITALCGIGIIALPTGVLAGAFSDALRRAREEREHGHDHLP